MQQESKRFVDPLFFACPHSDLEMLLPDADKEAIYQSSLEHAKYYFGHDKTSPAMRLRMQEFLGQTIRLTGVAANIVTEQDGTSRILLLEPQIVGQDKAGEFYPCAKPISVDSHIWLYLNDLLAFNMEQGIGFDTAENPMKSYRKTISIGDLVDLSVIVREYRGKVTTDGKYGVKYGIAKPFIVNSGYMAKTPKTNAVMIKSEYSRDAGFVYRIRFDKEKHKLVHEINPISDVIQELRTEKYREVLGDKFIEPKSKECVMANTKPRLKLTEDDIDWLVKMIESAPTTAIKARANVIRTLQSFSVKETAKKLKMDPKDIKRIEDNYFTYGLTKTVIGSFERVGEDKTKASKVETESTIPEVLKRDLQDKTIGAKECAQKHGIPVGRVYDLRKKLGVVFSKKELDALREVSRQKAMGQKGVGQNGTVKKSLATIFSKPVKKDKYVLPPEHISLLQDKSRTHNSLAVELNVPAHIIKKWRKELGVKFSDLERNALLQKTRPGVVSWVGENLKTITNLNLSDEEVSKITGASVNGVMQKRRKLGLSYKPTATNDTPKVVQHPAHKCNEYTSAIDKLRLEITQIETEREEYLKLVDARVSDIKSQIQQLTVKEAEKATGLPVVDLLAKIASGEFVINQVQGA